MLHLIMGNRRVKAEMDRYELTDLFGKDSFYGTISTVISADDKMLTGDEDRMRNQATFFATTIDESFFRHSAPEKKDSKIFLMFNLG